VQTIHLETELPASADRVWQAMCDPASFTYVTRGLIGVPALAGRTEPFREGETGTGWLLLFHLIPLHRHSCRYSDTIEIDAGPLTGTVAAVARQIFRYRQRRWHRLVRNHLMPSGPRYAAAGLARGGRRRRARR